MAKADHFRALYFHERLGIHANRSCWEALGWTSFEGRTVRDVAKLPETEELVLAGIHHTQERDEHALLWAIAERLRRREERTRVTSEAKLAAAIDKFSGALEQLGALMKGKETTT